MDTTTIVALCVFVGYLLLCAVCGIYVATEKNRSQNEGFLFGLLFGPLGLIVVACLPIGTAREDAANEDPEDGIVASVDRLLAPSRSVIDKRLGSPPSAETRRQARELLGEIDEK